jgi:hypothetical protein
MEQPEASGGSKKKKKRIFKNFAEYWHYAKILSEKQRQALAESLSRDEFKSLRASYDRGGWEDLFMRNACDLILDKIKRQHGVDLLEIRGKVLLGKPQLMQRQFWEYISNCFEQIPFEHILYIFEGVAVSQSNEDGYVKLSRIAPSTK